MSNIFEIHGTDKQEVPVEDVLKGGLEPDLAVVLVLGYRQDGSIYFATSTGDAGENLMLLSQLQLALIQS